ncbi:SecDF P1 head subdomain-containing protein [Rhizobium sp. LjRoot254]|uniref:SecDF P1 head subdomain-containing protein n=1 Tax=Rhizobium sp. LjRoot254 TaxID=3342297 RepID=UPI003ED0D51E
MAEELVVQVASAELAQDYAGLAAVAIRLSAKSASDFGVFTQARVGEKIEVKLNGRVLIAPVIRDPIYGGLMQISGDLTDAKARMLIDEIRKNGNTLVLSGSDK